MMSYPSSDDPTGKPADLFAGLVAGRECGTCVACCQILEIDRPELKKAADVICPHCTGTGCGIYTTRPDVCRAWYCLWRRIDVLPDDLRPDRTGVVFSIDQHDPPRTVFEKLYVVARAISDPARFNAKPVRAAIDMFIEEGSLPLWLSFNGQKMMIYPKPDFAAAIIDPNSSPSPDVAAKARDWRKQYGLAP